MNILILCCDLHSSILTQLHHAAGADGKLIAVGTDPWAASLYNADKWYLLLPTFDNEYITQVLNICRQESVSCVVPLDPRIRNLLSEEQKHFHQEGITLAVQEAQLQKYLDISPALLADYRSYFAQKKVPLYRRVYKSIARLLPLEFKEWLLLRKDYLTTYQDNKRIIRSPHSKTVYLLDSPIHSNLGDHAIAYAQREFITKTLPDARIVELPIQLVDMHLRFIRKHIRPDDLFCFIGGGNFGDAYIMHEQSKRKVCRMFPNHRVIIFPQTISYSDTPQGCLELELTQAVLNTHQHLTITARDKISHQRAQNWFPGAECILTPDIVLNLEPITSNSPRDGVLCCLRRDLERNKAVWAGDVVTKLANAGYRFRLSDTVGARGASLTERPMALARKWQEFLASELVVTDRLHGMIFSCITSTPCIVLDNYNHKIRDFYQTWLTVVPFIRFAEKIEDILPLVQELLEQQSFRWERDWVEGKYAPLAEALRKDLPHE